MKETVGLARTLVKSKHVDDNTKAMLLQLIVKLEEPMDSEAEIARLRQAVKTLMLPTSPCPPTYGDCLCCEDCSDHWLEWAKGGEG